MPENDFPQPVIILGSPRSFTSLMCTMVGQHPEAYGVPELNLFVADNLEQLIESMTGYRQIQLHGLLRTVAHLNSGEQTLLSLDMARRWMIPRLKRSTAEVYQELCRNVAPLRIIDKSPVYSLDPKNLERIHRAFPDAFYLHLLRNPRTQGESIMKVAKGAMAVLANSIDYSTNPPTVDPQISWHQMQRNILAFMEHIPEHKKIRLRGEDFLNEPRAYLEEICDWLGMSRGKQAIEAMLHPEDSPFARLGPLGAHLGNDINFLRSPKLRPGRVGSPPLAGPLPWRKDGQGFSKQVLTMAKQMGYD